MANARFNAALSDLEKRIEKNVDLKLATRLMDLRKELSLRMDNLDKQNELVEDELFTEIQDILASLEHNCKSNADEIKNLKEKLDHLEQFIAETAIEQGYLLPEEEKNTSFKDESEDVITDDLSL